VAWPDDDADGLDPTVERAPGADFAEILTVDRWVARNAGRLRVAAVDGELASALPRIGVREPVPPPKAPESRNPPKTPGPPAPRTHGPSTGPQG